MRTDNRTDKRADKPDNFCDVLEIAVQFAISQGVAQKAGRMGERQDVRFRPVFGGKLSRSDMFRQIAYPDISLRQHSFGNSGTRGINAIFGRMREVCWSG